MEIKFAQIRLWTSTTFLSMISTTRYVVRDARAVMHVGIAN